MIWVISGGNFGWKSAGISTQLQNLPLLIKVWQSRMQLRLFCQELADIPRLLTNFFLDFNHVRFLKQYQNCIVTSSYAWESVFLMITRSNLGEGVHPSPEILTSTHGMKLKFIPAILLDKRCWLKTSLFWSRDPHVFYRPKNHFCWSQHKWKMTSSMNFFYQGKLLVKDSSWYHHQIPRYCMVVNFPYNAWSVNSDQPKTRTILHMLSCLVRGYFNFKMFVTKFCSLGQSFISIAQVVLEL